MNMPHALHDELERKRHMLKQTNHTSLAKLEDILHQKLSGTYLADIVFGANDGIITTFAVIAGAQGGALSKTVIIILGCANLLGDGISMGAGNFLGAKSEIEYQKKQRAKEEWEVENFPEIETQEIREIYTAKGFAGSDLDRAVAIITSDRKRWIDEMMLCELRIIEDKGETPVKRGIVTFIAFVIAGSIPLFPFVVTVSPEYRFPVASVSAAAALFIVGSLRSRVIVKNWIRAGVEMLVVGILAAGSAYGIGMVLQSII